MMSRKCDFCASKIKTSAGRQVSVTAASTEKQASDHITNPLRMTYRGREGVYIDVFAMRTEGEGSQTFPKFCVCNT